MPDNFIPINQPLAERRSFLARCLGLGAVSLGLMSSVHSRALAQQANPAKRQLINQAFDMKQQAVEAGDQAYGAVVVKQGKIIGYGPSRVITDQDPTAHAEMVAIREAAKKLGSRDLSDCELYSTSPPCRMCETAAYWGGISRMYHGDSGIDGGAPGYGC